MKIKKTINEYVFKYDGIVKKNHITIPSLCINPHIVLKSLLIVSFFVTWFDIFKCVQILWGNFTVNAHFFYNLFMFHVLIPL